MLSNAIPEARRQVEICNACRYCEGYCSVFPSINRERNFADEDIIHLANLCHNCRGCYYACQYTAPHEFALNIPNILAEVRQESWQNHAWPKAFTPLFHKSGVAVGSALIAGLILFFWIALTLRPQTGEGFYAHLSHGMMVVIFLLAFLFPLFSITMSLLKYWKRIDGGRISLRDIMTALDFVARMRDLSGGHGEGCNFEDEDRFSNTRRWFHQATMYGFALCFAATSAGTLLHYVFDLKGPHDLISMPKLLGIPGGLLLCIGTLGLVWLKLKADRNLGSTKVWGGEMAFVLLLFTVSATGLALFASTGTGFVALFLPVHLGAVLTFFLLTPYSKMVHGFYRFAALAHEAKRSKSG